MEILIATAIGGILTMGLLQQFTLQQNMVVTTEANFDTIDFLNQVRSVLSESEACKKTFLGVTIDPTPVTTSQIWRAYKDSSLVWQYPVAYTAGANVGQTLKINSMTISGANPTNGLAELKIEIERLKLGVMGSKVVTRTVPLYISVDASNAITACTGGGGGGSIDLSNYVTKTELRNVKPVAELPVHRSWLAAPWHDPNAGQASPNNEPRMLFTGNVCGGWMTIHSYVVPSVTYTRMIQADTFFLTSHDSAGSDVTQASMDFGGTYTQRLTTSTEGWGGTVMHLTGIYSQPANTPVTIRIQARNIVGGCSWIDTARLHLIVKEL